MLVKPFSEYSPNILPEGDAEWYHIVISLLFKSNLSIHTLTTNLVYLGERSYTLQKMLNIRLKQTWKGDSESLQKSPLNANCPISQPCLFYNQVEKRSLRSKH